MSLYLAMLFRVFRVDTPSCLAVGKVIHILWDGDSC